MAAAAAPTSSRKALLTKIVGLVMRSHYSRDVLVTRGRSLGRGSGDRRPAPVDLRRPRARTGSGCLLRPASEARRRADQALTSCHLCPARLTVPPSRGRGVPHVALRSRPGISARVGRGQPEPNATSSVREQELVRVELDERGGQARVRSGREGQLDRDSDELVVEADRARSAKHGERCSRGGVQIVRLVAGREGVAQRREQPSARVVGGELQGLDQQSVARPEPGPVECRARASRAAPSPGSCAVGSRGGSSRRPSRSGRC